jgi:RNA polymerase sigma-70 factor (ECF subfamily)
VPTRANGQPTFGAYLRLPAGIRPGAGIYVLTVTGNQIGALSHFDRGLLPRFGLPESLPGRG